METECRRKLDMECPAAGTELLSSEVFDESSISRVPKVGECILVNERCGNFSREHGGRYWYDEPLRRYFGTVSEIHRYVVVIQLPSGSYVAERVSDFEVGLIKYLRLKEMPVEERNITYDDKELDSFVESFESLLLL